MAKPSKKTPLSKAAVKVIAARAEAKSKGKALPPKVKAPSPLNPPENPVGRPTKYKPEYAEIAKSMCKLGATDYELAEAFGVRTVTIWRWQATHPEFCSALKVMKETYDDRVERSLAQRATGYSYHTKKVFQFRGQIVEAEIIEHVPPDPGAAKLWLTNRRPKDWRDLRQVEMGGPGDFAGMTEDQLLDMDEELAGQIEDAVVHDGNETMN